MPFLELPHGDVHYLDVGRGDPVVLVHGRSASAACWDWHIERLRGRYRVIAYDSVNHGFSSNSPRDQPEPDRCDELDDVLRHLALRRPLLVGQSMGAITVLRWVSGGRGVCRGVVAAGMGWPMPAQDRAPLPPLRDGLWIEAKRFDPQWAAAHSIEVDRYSRLRSTATAIEAMRHPRDPGTNLQEFFAPAFADRLRSIDVPVHLFMGTDDYFASSAATMAELIPECTLRMVPRADHSAYIQAVDDLVALIDTAMAGSTR